MYTLNITFPFEQKINSLYSFAVQSYFVYLNSLLCYGIRSFEINVDNMATIYLGIY